MGITQAVGTEHNLYWNLGNIAGNEFEEIIYNVLSAELKPHLYNDVKIISTPLVNDGGKDIIIEFSCETLDLFGITFYKGEKSNAKVYIECKSTNSKQALRREKFMPSIERGSKDIIDFYVLLTNSKILPVDYFEAESFLNSRKIQFVLIDQYLLARFLKEKNYSYFPTLPLYEGKDEFYVQYQVYPNNLNENTYDIYFTFRNYSQVIQNYTISLLTDANWSTEENSFSFTVEANCACSKKISIVCEHENEYKTLVFKVETGKFESFVNIEGVNIEESYTPPFIGQYHNKILSHMFENITQPICDRLFCLWGEAGIGKTRIVNELKNRLIDGYFDIYECSLKKNNASTIKDIKEFLVKKKYISNNTKEFNSMNLQDIILNCNNSYRVAIIFIDDFHNSTSEFIEQIKTLCNHSAPVILILCGRTDYLEGDTKYYSFVQWTLDNLKRQQKVWTVKPLRPKETKNLIRVMINEIPDEALNTIYKFSDNNPLYVVQFIEYLLDEKIAYIVHRNTVGIINPAKFQSHNFLPNGIAGIYQKRIKYLEQESNKEAKNYLKFLFILTLFGGQISVNIAEHYFDLDGTVVSFLHKRGFISRRKNYFIFYHESLKLYVQNILIGSEAYKKDTSDYILNLPEQAWTDLPIYTKGRIYLWSGNIAKSIEIFTPIIDTIKDIKNISNIDIDPSIYEYLDDILQIFKNKSEYRGLISKIINVKVYINLHHFVPINAATECDKSLSYIRNSPVLKGDNKLILSLLVQKAHSLLNSGMNMEGELVLKELQAKWMVSREQFDSQSVFDMFDRLCAIYIKFNCYDMACDYNKLELDVAKGEKDNSLAAIAYRTRSKLFYLNDPDECLDSLNKVDELLKTNASPRIQLNNEIYRAIVELTYNSSNKYDEIIERVEKLRHRASEQNLNRADIQSNMVLAAAYLKRGSSKDLIIARKTAMRAINCSISYGIPSYMWQLYNLVAIIDTKLKKSNDKVKQSFENAFDIMDKQNLLFIGRNNLCYSNILAISNMGFFLSRFSFQKTFNSRMSRITYCESDTEYQKEEKHHKRLTQFELTEIYEKAKKQELLFSLSNSSNLLRDNETGYFIALT